MAFTAHDITAAEATALGFDAVVQKPADIDVLVVHLEQLLAHDRPVVQ